MNVRTITVGLPTAQLADLPALEPRLARFFDALRAELARHDIATRTCRIMMAPIREEAERRVNPAHAMGLVKAVAQLCERLAIRWFNVPFDLTRHTHSTTLESLGELAFEVVRRFPRSFINLICADAGRISHQAAARASRLIKSVAGLETSGYHNFRVGVGCNVKPNTPFFPFAFSGDELGFSLGLEMPQQLMKVVNGMPGASLPQLREALLETLLPQVERIEAIATRVGAEYAIACHGIDVSIAPYPEPGGSVAQLMELLGVEQYGGHGTLLITAFLTDLLKELVRRAGLETVGFNGVMLSLLEDEYMGRRNNQGLYSIDSLILYSTVCGCGVDMVPIPGDTFEDEITALILDVSAASAVLGKPLGVRVLPIPMKHEGEFTAFNMDFLFNTRIKKVRNLGLPAARMGAQPLELRRRSGR